MVGVQVMAQLSTIPEAMAMMAVERFASSNLGTVRNKSGFLVGVIKRVKEENGLQ